MRFRRDARLLPIRRIEHAMRGLPVSQTYHSVGSWISLDFGRLTVDETSRRGMSYGEYSVFTPNARWSIARHGRPLATSDSKRVEIRRVLELIVGAHICRVRFSHQCSTFSFSAGWQFILEPCPWSNRRRLDRDDWYLFHDRKVILVSDYAFPYLFMLHRLPASPYRQTK